MKTILVLLVLNLLVISAQRFDQSVAPRPRTCSLIGGNSCPRGYVCRRVPIHCAIAPCPQSPPTCQRISCQLNGWNSCPRGSVCRRTAVPCWSPPCPEYLSCQSRSCQELRCPPGLICRDGRSSRPARCVRSTGQIGNSCPSGSVQIGNRRCFSSTQCGSSRRSFCNNRGGFAGGVCCSRSNQFGGQKPGRCPRRSRNQNQFTTCDVRCVSDDQCRGSSKCCQIGCHRACTEPDFALFPF